MSIIIPANTLASGGYEVDNSLRFNDGSSDKLSRSSGTPSSRQKFTWSQWVKRSADTDYQVIQGCYSDTSNYLLVSFNSDRIDVIDFESGVNARKITTAKFVDFSAFYHIVVAVDTTQATANNRVKIYVNGVLQTAFDTNTAPSKDQNLSTNESTYEIGSGEAGNYYFDGYLAECIYCDGQSLAADSFGEFDDTGIWKPIKVSGLTFGDEGFYLEFKQVGTSANASGIGADTSGNTHHFTVANLTAVDQSTDTCTNNFATMNPLDNFYAGGTFAEGNLQVTTRNAGYSYNTATFGVATGKWYWEVKWSAQNTGSTNQVVIGIAKRNVVSTTVWLGSVAWTFAYEGSSGHVKVSDGNATNSTSTTYSVGDIISVAMDLDNNKIHFAKNGTYTNSSDAAGNSGGVTITAADSTSGDSGFYFPAFGDGNNNLVQTGQFNFGSPPYAISSSNADGDGFGNFEYAVPSGYFALCTKNLAEYG